MVEAQNVEKKKGNKGLIIILILALILIGAGVLLGTGLIGGKTEEKEEKESTTTSEKIMSDADKKFMESFAEAGLYHDEGQGGLAVMFMGGKDGLSEEEKITLVYFSLVGVQKKAQKITTIPDKYNSEGYWHNARLFELPISTFKEEYKKFFQEEVVLSHVKDAIKACPFVYTIEEDIGMMYFSHECGGAGGSEYYHKTYKYDEDNNYFYLYQYIGEKATDTDGKVVFKNPNSGQTVEADSFEGNEEKFDTLVWKFKKNLVFVSTEAKDRSS